MKSSTLKRILRIAAALLAVAFWQFLAVPVIYFMMSQPLSPDPYEPPMKFEEWALYTQPDATFTQMFWSITIGQFFGLIATGAVMLIIWLLYKLVKFIWYGHSDYPPCTDPNCPCNRHKQGDVFKDGQWDDSECTDPECPCVNWHANQRFSKAQGKWVDV
jgi:hypothetical protein